MIRNGGGLIDVTLCDGFLYCGIKFNARKTYSAVNYFPAFYIVFCYIPSKKKMIIIFPITSQCKIVYIFEQIFVRAFWGAK